MHTKRLRAGRLRRGVLSALTVLATASLVAGCSAQGSGGGGSSKNEPADHPTGTLKIVVSSAPGSDAGFKAVNAAFAKKYPDVKIEFSSIPNNNYPSAQASRLSAGNIDVGLAGPKELPSYVPESNKGDDARLADAGGFVDLSNMDFLKNFTPSVMDSLKYKGKSYVIPTGLSYYTGVYYNKSIFEKYNLSIPTTWDEFVTLCQTLQQDGVTPLGIGGKDSWPAGLNMLAAVQGQYPTADDKNALAKGLWEQSIKLTDSKPLEVMKRTEQMYQFAQKNFAGVPYSSITSGFVKGDFAMTADGTWNETTIEAAAGPDFKFGYFPIPTSDNAADNANLGGKVELTLVVPSNSKNIPAALAYLKFFSQPENYKLFVAKAGFAPSEPGISLTPFYNSIQQYTKQFSPAWDTLWVANTKSGPKATFPFDYPDLKPLGGMSPQQAAEAAQKDWAAGF